MLAVRAQRRRRAAFEFVRQIEAVAGFDLDRRHAFARSARRDAAATGATSSSSSQRASPGPWRRCRRRRARSLRSSRRAAASRIRAARFPRVDQMRVAIDQARGDPATVAMRSSLWRFAASSASPLPRRRRRCVPRGPQSRRVRWRPRRPDAARASPAARRSRADHMKRRAPWPRTGPGFAQLHFLMDRHNEGEIKRGGGSEPLPPLRGKGLAAIYLMNPATSTIHLTKP